MTCTRTGAHIFLAEYGKYAYCDAFEVGPVAYFRIVQTGRRPLDHFLHYTVTRIDNWWDRHDSRISTLITREGGFINHGYSGIECPPVPYEETE